MVATNTRQLNCAALFHAKGYMPSGAAGLVGNFCVESGPALSVAFRRHDLDHGSQGLAQWRGSRLDAYMKFVAVKHPDAASDELWAQYGRLDYQVDFVDHELATDYPALHAKLKAGGLVASLATDICWQYERPNKALAHIADRIAHARAIYAAAVKVPATPVNVANALDIVAAEHDKSTAGAAIAATASAGLAGAVVLNHVATSLSWWEWAGLGVPSFVILGAISSMVSSAAKATAVRAAKVAVDIHAPAQPMLASAKTATPPAAQPATAPKTSAAQEEAAAIAAALKGHPVDVQVAARAGLAPVPQAKPVTMPMVATLASQNPAGEVSPTILGPDGTPAHAPMMSIGKVQPDA